MDYDCDCVMDDDHLDHFALASVCCNKLRSTREQNQLAKDNERKLVTTRNIGANGKPFCC